MEDKLPETQDMDLNSTSTQQTHCSSDNDCERNKTPIILGVSALCIIILLVIIIIILIYKQRLGITRGSPEIETDTVQVISPIESSQSILTLTSSPKQWPFARFELSTERTRNINLKTEILNHPKLTIPLLSKNSNSSMDTSSSHDWATYSSPESNLPNLNCQDVNNIKCSKSPKDTFYCNISNDPDINAVNNVTWDEDKTNKLCSSKTSPYKRKYYENKEIAAEDCFNKERFNEVYVNRTISDELREQIGNELCSNIKKHEEMHSNDKIYTNFHTRVQTRSNSNGNADPDGTLDTENVYKNCKEIEDTSDGFEIYTNVTPTSPPNLVSDTKNKCGNNEHSHDGGHSVTSLRTPSFPGISKIMGANGASSSTVKFKKDEAMDAHSVYSHLGAESNVVINAYDVFS